MPTVLEMAGIDIPNIVDGKSFYKLIDNDTNNDDDIKWRDRILVEFMEPFNQYFNVCATWYEKDNDFHGINVNSDTYQDTNNINETLMVAFGLNVDPGNNYRMIRIINDTINWTYAEYVSYTFTPNALANPYLFVLYDLNSDPYQLNNIYNNIMQLYIIK
mmetsp:Transcript_31992/g.39282  ORF Transcript_31992/g.39282 Transcript_31992/m.39282 type:complete len:160 (-) Transcript_31992:14-493(-)